MKIIRWILGVFLLLSSGHSKTQMLVGFQDLPVSWQKMEKWQWQGQSISSQRFSTDQDVFFITQQIQQRIATDLRLQRLSSSWLLSFNQDHTHYLILLSAQQNGTQGWLSSLSLKEQSVSASFVDPPVIFSGLYQHSWYLQSTEFSGPDYFVLKPLISEKKKINHDWLELMHRLKRQGWRGSFCKKSSSWCQWEQGVQKLMVWVDPKNGLWHVLWWPKFLGEKK